MSTLTDRAIQAAKPKRTAGKLIDNWLSDGGARGAGRLYLRVPPSGRKIFYFRYAGPDGDRQTLALGDYAQKGGRAGLSLTDARDKSSELARMYQSGIKDLRGYLDAHQAAQVRDLHASNAAAQQAQDEAKRGSLRNLLDAYIEALERAKKTDAKDVRGLFRLHVLEPFPELVDRKASDLKAKDLRGVLARLVDADKGRSAGKLRSYMRAAYASAIKAEFDPTAPASMIGFGIEANPCDALPSLSKFNVPGERTLSETELKLYIDAVEALPRISRDALLLSLYLAGQRPTQLVRITTADVDLTETGGEVRLRDPKGARQHARLHVLPLVGKSHALLAALSELYASGYLLSNPAETRARVPVGVGTLSTAVNKISKGLMKAKKVKAPFRLGDIRRTVETMLASMGISRDVRAQLLSHGLGGVQDRNYDRHSYMDEKRAALVAWEAKLKAIRSGSAQPGNVVSLEQARAA